MRARADGVHRRIPRHVRHEQHQRVDRIGIARDRVRDDHVHQPVRGERRLPRVRLVDAQRLALARRSPGPRARAGSPAAAAAAACWVAPACCSAGAAWAESASGTARARGNCPGRRARRAASGADAAHGRSGSHCECAEIPRIAYMATGRPTTLSCSRPHTSVQCIGKLDRFLERDMRHLAREPADRVAAGTPQASVTTCSGA